MFGHHRHRRVLAGEGEVSRPGGAGTGDGGVMRAKTKAMLVAAPRSGAGKTTVTLALLSAFRRRGLRVVAAKCGPDYIDPAFHAVASGAPCLNLDSWAMGPALLNSVAYEAAAGADLLIVESAMGLFDGAAGGRIGEGAAAELAVQLRLPVLLVLDVAGQAQSGAAVALGIASFDPRVRIGGIVLNRVGSDRHRAAIERAIATLDIPMVGVIPRDEAIHLPERHLGLVQALEHDDLDLRTRRLADIAERHCNLALIRELAAPLRVESRPAAALPAPGQRIALASDAAFAFTYPHVLSGWRRAGAEIVSFSPLADEPPPEDCDSCWLPGGYPELHASTLANAGRFKSGLRHFAATRPVHGECGGYMVLGEWLVDADGVRHSMAGLLTHVTSFAERCLHLGYRAATLLQDCPLGPAGTRLRGHAFHYATLIDPGADEPLAELFDAERSALGPSGGRRGHVTGTFFHAIACEEAQVAQAQQKLAKLA
jgi:cobyrinic acid a,c-diamide synthase